MPARWLRVVPGALLAVLLLISAAIAHFSPQSPAAKARSAAPQAADLNATPYDFAPSPMRQRVLDRREAGLPVPNPGRLLLQQQAQDNAAHLQQERELVAKYFSEIQDRDAAIAKLNQMIQENQTDLASLASQLGLPKDRMAALPPAQKGQGAATPLDLAIFAAPHPEVTASDGMVSSFGDLTSLVARYLNIWCPLPPSDVRCGQAIDHAREQLARGHGLDSNRPDASPTLYMSVAQRFGLTDVEFEPQLMLGGKLVHFHDGLDLGGNYDEPVMAAAAGTVVFAGVVPSGALSVEIAHAGGLHTIYMHEEQLLVRQGQPVQKGQIIGLVGATGMATGPHVHFMIVEPSGRPIDPLRFIR